MLFQKKYTINFHEILYVEMTIKPFHFSSVSNYVRNTDIIYICNVLVFSGEELRLLYVSQQRLIRKPMRFNVLAAMERFPKQLL